MLKRIVIVTGIVITAITLFILLNKSLADDQAVANNNEGQNPLLTEEKKTIATLEMITEKLHPEFHSFVVSSNSNDEINIQVWSDEDYFNSVKKEMESIAKHVIQSSPLKEYTIVVKRIDSTFVLEEDKERHEELFFLIESLNDGLKEFDIGTIDTDIASISIHTAITGTDKDALKLAMEIKEKAIEIVGSKELNTVSIESYKIQILDANGKVLVNVSS